MNFYSHAPRGARHRQSPENTASDNFYSHAPRGARLLPAAQAVPPPENFYSHAPRGARRLWRASWDPTSKFLLTRPSRGATVHDPAGSGGTEISTHTPLAGRDVPSFAAFSMCLISTHTPLAGRDKVRVRFYRADGRFLLTRPSRGATLLPSI